MTRDLTVERRPTPLGDMLFVADEDGALRAAEFADCEARLKLLLDRRARPGGYRLAPGRVPVDITQAFDGYFGGDLGALDAVAVSFGGTAFQEEVWNALRQIEPGRPLSYSDLARLLDRPLAARAVGHANGANPLSIVVPCHRLVGANGSLTGYAGGVERKRWLLDHETRHASSRRATDPPP